MNIAIISAGSLGTAMAIRLSSCFPKVNLWSRNPEVVEGINTYRINPHYLSDFVIPERVAAMADIEEAVSRSEYILLAVPCLALPSILETISPYLREKVMLSMIKGFTRFENSWMSPSEIIETFQPKGLGLLMGPGFARDIADPKNPIGLGLASRSDELKADISELFRGSNIRMYPSDDIVGFELSCAIKNIIAIAAGMAKEMFGDSTAALVIARGEAEMVNIVTKLGGSKDTFREGSLVKEDLQMTCFSDLSRNRSIGRCLGKDRRHRFTRSDIGQMLLGVKGTGEGVNSAQAIIKLLVAPMTDAPVTYHVHQVLSGRMSPLEAAESLSLVRKTIALPQTV